MHDSPRILTLTGTPHPKALVQSIDAAAGALVFAWLNADGAQVDSGGSVARFTPLAPIEQAPDYTGPAEYPEVDDAVLIDAIENPPAAPTPRHRVLKDTLWMRVKALGHQAAAVAAISSLPTSQRLDWDAQSWFWSDNDAIRAVLAEIGASAPEIEQILAPDPLAP